MRRAFAIPEVPAARRGYMALGAVLLIVVAVALLQNPQPRYATSERTHQVTMTYPQGSLARDREVSPLAARPSSVAAFTVGDVRPPASEAPRIPDARIIRTGSAVLRCDSLGAALARADSIATRLGGFVTTSDETGADAGVTGGSLTLRVPSASFDRLVAGLTHLGRLERLHVETQDVGEEYVDVEARIANGRRLEARLIALVATRTGRLSDVLEAEQQLARVRENIDGLIGRQRYLDRSVAMSTLSLEVVAAAPTAVTEPGTFRVAAQDAWTSFVWLLAFVVRISGVVLPLVLVASGAWWLARRRAEA